MRVQDAEEFKLPLTVTYAIRELVAAADPGEPAYAGERAWRFHEWFQESSWRTAGSDPRALREAWREWLRQLSRVRLVDWWRVLPQDRTGPEWFVPQSCPLPGAQAREQWVESATKAAKVHYWTHMDGVRALARMLVADRARIAAIKATM